MGLGMAGSTLLGAKCLLSAGAARASIKSRVPVSILTLHFSVGGLRGPVPQRDLSHLALSPCAASWWYLRPEPAPSLGRQQECEEPHLL